MRAVVRGVEIGAVYSVVRIDPGALGGVPALVAQIRGRKLYDPRTDTTVYSSNPALALADFLDNPVYGKGALVDLVEGVKRLMVHNQFICYMIDF
jgi:hypothetical protein